MTTTDDFREDLYFRINTFEIRLPSLRERRDDILPLAEHLLLRAARGKPVSSRITPQAASVLTSYDWPGNVRELANVMEYALVLSAGEAITPDHLPSQLNKTPAGAALSVVSDKPLSLHDVEMRYIVQLLEKNEGNKPETAKQLGISLKTLYNKLNALPEGPSSLAG
jgi:DNA-binding NtrC family response regulator